MTASIQQMPALVSIRSGTCSICSRSLQMTVNNGAINILKLLAAIAIDVGTYISAGITLVSIAIGIKSNRHLFLHDHIVHSMVISDEDVIAKTTAVIK